MRIPIQLNPDSAEPLYHQIEVQLRGMIVSGRLPPGTLLPSIREFAQELSCSVITIRRVYQDLESEGMLRTRQGTGTFVAQVEEPEREQYRQEAVAAALRTAIDTALQLHCPPIELRRMFEEELIKRLTDEPGPSRKGDRK
ncbi:GntR family transcriptional regulator [Paenibacillus chartarius]|uniref:GntR family transcriptional regulator n=1 Tax=Paenibacillus chartarius TaxID=747481 RepID=A0ABV6DG88_9BACL